MTFHHIAVWSNEPEKLRDFYVTWFDGKSNELYENPSKGFSSYFVTFSNGLSIEIMKRTDITRTDPQSRIGLTHIAFLVDSQTAVTEMIERFRTSGISIVGEPRMTGDGYFEGAILDLDGNLVEIVAYKDICVSKAGAPPYDLLLLADPEKEKIDSYLPSSDCYVATYNDKAVGVIVAQKLDDNTGEIMNMAVEESFQRRGIGRRLLQMIINNWSKENSLNRLIIRTGTSAPGPMMLYQQEGFDIVDIQYNYFTNQYKEPIFENGVQCKHQIILELSIY